MSNPTEEQIRRVKTNLTNMIAFNEQLQIEGNVKILNAFALLSIPDNKDLGLQIGLNLLCGSISAISGLTAYGTRGTSYPGQQYGLEPKSAPALRAPNG